MQVQIPFSSNQPVNLPIAVFQSDNAATIQGVISLSSIQINRQLAKIDEGAIRAAQIAETIVIIKDALFSEKYNKAIPKDQIQSIAISSSMTRYEESFERVKQDLPKTSYSLIIDQINGMGFNLGYFKDSTIGSASGEKVTYSPVTNLNKKKIGILISFSVICGGIDFSRAELVEQNSNIVKDFISSATQDELLKTLEKIYG